MAEQPSLGGAIALQGRNTIAEQLGRMQLQSAQRAGDVAAKKAALDAKRVAEIEEKFAIPKGQYHRLVIPEIAKVQAKYLNEVKTLKAERPNNWQNDIQNLANRYTSEMEKLETLSKDLSDYDTKTATIDRGNTYFSNEWKKYNSAYETAQNLDDFKVKLATSGFDPSKATDFVVRPNGSISYTPFANQKPLETITEEIRKIPTVEFSEQVMAGPQGTTQIKRVKKRPITDEEAKQILNDPQYRKLYASIDEIMTAEKVVGNYLLSNPYGARQYADQNNLPLRQNADGSFVLADLVNVKKHILEKVKPMSNPNIATSLIFPKGGTVVNVNTGQTEETGLTGGGTWAPGQYRARQYGKPSYVAWDYNYNFDKEPQILNLKAENSFDSEFNPVVAGPREVQATGLVLLLVDKNGNPIDASQADNAKNVTGAGIFVRLLEGNDYLFQKVENYNNLSSQFLKKTSKKLENDYIDANIKRKKMLENIQKLRQQGTYDFQKFATVPG